MQLVGHDADADGLVMRRCPRCCSRCATNGRRAAWLSASSLRRTSRSWCRRCGAGEALARVYNQNVISRKLILSAHTGLMHKLFWLKGSGQLSVQIVHVLQWLRHYILTSVAAIKADTAACKVCDQGGSVTHDCHAEHVGCHHAVFHTFGLGRRPMVRCVGVACIDA